MVIAGRSAVLDGNRLEANICVLKIEVVVWKAMRSVEDLWKYLYLPFGWFRGGV